MNKYPEHKKLSAISSQSQAAGSFLDWLQEEKKATLAVRHEHDEFCFDGAGSRRCGYVENELMPGHFRIESLLAEFFRIDEKKIEQEKQAMLEELRT